MRVLAGDLPAGESYIVSGTGIQRLFTTYDLAGASVVPVTGADKKDPTRIAHTTTGGLAGFLLAGPVGALAGGAAGFAGAKGTQAGMVFDLTLADGRKATCHGDMKEYAKIQAGIRSATHGAVSFEPSLADRNRIRAELSEKKVAAKRVKEDARADAKTARESYKRSSREREPQVAVPDEDRRPFAANSQHLGWGWTLVILGALAVPARLRELPNLGAVDLIASVVVGIGLVVWGVYLLRGTSRKPSNGDK